MRIDNVKKWGMVKLREAVIVDKKPILPNNLNDENIYIGLEDIDKETGVINTIRYAKECDIKSNKFKFTSEHILYGKLRPNLNKVAVPDFNGICSTDIYPILSHKEKAFKKYIYHILHSQEFVKYASSRTNGANLPRVNERIITDYEIPLPPLETQKQIAKTLDTVAELLAMHKQQLTELENLIKSTFYDMFGDPVANENGWEIKKLSEIGDLNRGISKHRPRNDPAILGGVHPLIQTGDVANSDFIIREYKQTYSDLGLKQSKKWSVGTLCITIAANIAKTAIMGFDACFPDSVVGFTANKQTNNIFIFSWFGFFQKILEAQAPESAQKNINLRILNGLDIILPPIELQTQFAEIVTKIEEQKALVKKAINETQYLFDSLMSEYFE